MELKVESWHSLLKEGDGFLTSAIKGRERRPDVFTAPVVYNLAAMAVEKYLMAFLMSRGEMPYGHTMGDILQMVESVQGPGPELSRRIMWLDTFQEICDLDSYKTRDPTPEELEQILEVGGLVAQFVRDNI